MEDNGAREQLVRVVVWETTIGGDVLEKQAALVRILMERRSPAFSLRPWQVPSGTARLCIESQPTFWKN